MESHIFNDSNQFYSNFSTFTINSAVRMLDTMSSRKFLINQPRSARRLNDVHWLSHDLAIKAVIRTYPSILVSLDREASERGEPTAHGLLKFMI